MMDKSSHRPDCSEDYIDGLAADFFIADESEFIEELNSNNYKWKFLMENDEGKEHTHVNVEAKDGVVEIVHRYGAAAEIQEPKAVNISGSIEAPGEYFKARKDTEYIDEDKAHLEVWQDKGWLKLITDPSSPVGTTVIGEMKPNPALANMDINKFGQTKYAEDDFILLLKESRPLFADQKVCMDIVDKINNLSIKVDQKIDREDNERGNKKDYYEQVVESDLPNSFDLTTNIFVASKDKTQDHTFTVDIKYHYRGGLLFWLESDELKDKKDEIMDEIVAEQVGIFADEIPVIYK